MESGPSSSQELEQSKSFSFMDQRAYQINFKLILRNGLPSSDVIENYCREITIEALKTMARMLNEKCEIDMTEDNIEKNVRSQIFIKQTTAEHIVKLDNPRKWIVFDSGSGHNHHCASSIYFYINFTNDSILADQKHHDIAMLIHELSHLYGCLHASEGIMSGKYGTSFTELFFDDLSLSVLNLTHPFIAPSSVMAPIKFKWLTEHSLIVYCADGIECLVLESRGTYADIICSQEKLFKYQIEMESFHQCIAISAKRYVFHVPLSGQSSDFDILNNIMSP